MRIYPSNAHIWVKCAGHTALAARTPRIEPQDDTERLEGILAHGVAEDIAATGVTKRADVTDEMLDGGVLWRDVLQSWGCEFAQEVAYETVEWLGNDVPARTDAEGYDPLHNVLHVADYKFGHRYIEAFENWQLMCYAMAYLGRHVKSFTQEQLDTMTVTLHVVQPRAGGHRQWGLPLKTLRETYAKTLSEAAGNIRLLESNPDGMGLKTYTVGEHCYKCAGAINCAALRTATSQALDFGGRAIELELTPEQAALELFLIDNAETHIKNRRDALEQLVEHSLHNGTLLPHWELKRGRGSVKWMQDKEQEVIALGDLYGAEITATKLKTPTQCKKLLPAYVIDSFTEQTQGALKVSKKNADDGAKLFNTHSE